MPKEKIVLPENLPSPRGAYSAALRCGDFIYVAGQSARDAKLEIVGASIEEQTRRTLENIGGILEAAGASMADVVKSTVHLSDLNNFKRYDVVYAELVPEPCPVRTTVGSVLAPGILVEIDVVAYVG
ncbi:RidA family protein [Tardiphaga sp. 866_E4_N2_1]|uniref:RidA family protein n=1 Tax=unclassified Tardiphaga TaxID=2631404 RepID=UPI003F26065E